MMNIPEIPETATETYLERLSEKITVQIEKARSRRVKERLEAMFTEVQRRLEEVRAEEAAAREAEEREAQAQKTLEESFFDTAKLNEQQQGLVKERLSSVLEEIKAQRAAAHQAPLPEGGEEGILDAGELSAEEQQLVKQRLAEMLKEAQRHQEEDLETFSLFEEEEPEPPPEEPGLTFEEVCKKVSNGESLDLFQKLELTEKEQALLLAFNQYLSKTRGLKQQQVFDLQHLTSRSIRDLEKIFKTYQLRGYLYAELHNVYNRLLNLRSRFSTLLR